MAESKKKRSSTVRTRVVSTDQSDKSKVKAKASKGTSPKTESSRGVTKPLSPKQAGVQDKAPKQKQAKATKTSKELGYFKGAWYELKQVRWPDRKATWSLTVAVLLFTAFFVALVLVLDAAFKFLFDLIIK